MLCSTANSCIMSKLLRLSQIQLACKQLLCKHASIFFLFLGSGTGKSKSEPRARGRNVRETNSLPHAHLPKHWMVCSKMYREWATVCFYCVLTNRSECCSFLAHVFGSDVSRLTLHCKGHTQVANTRGSVYYIWKHQIVGGMIANRQQPIRSN